MNLNGMACEPQPPSQESAECRVQSGGYQGVVVQARSETGDSAPTTCDRVWSLRREVWGLGYGVGCWGYGVWGVGFEVWGEGRGVEVLSYRERHHALGVRHVLVVLPRLEVGERRRAGCGVRHHLER